MSHTITFDTLEFAKTLEMEGGYQAKQAETLSKALKQVFQSAEQSFQASETRFQDDLKGLKNELATKADLKAEIANARAEIIKWVAGIIGIQTIVIIATIAGALAAFGRFSA